MNTIKGQIYSRTKKQTKTHAVNSDINIQAYPSVQEKVYREEEIGTAQDKIALSRLETNTNRSLLSIKTVFPFDMLPNTITIDQNKVDIVIRNFLMAEEIHSLLITDIKTVTVSSSVLFASIFFELDGYEKNPPHIPYIWKREAIQAQSIIQGLITCSKEGVDISNFTIEQIKEALATIGQTHR